MQPLDLPDSTDPKQEMDARPSTRYRPCRGAEDAGDKSNVIDWRMEKTRRQSRIIRLRLRDNPLLWYENFTSPEASPPVKPKTTFLDLPPEIRRLVYQHLIPPLVYRHHLEKQPRGRVHIITMGGLRRVGPESPDYLAISETCRLLREDFSEFLKTFTLHIDAHPRTLHSTADVDADQFSLTVPLFMRRHIQNITVQVPNISYQMHLRDLVECIGNFVLEIQFDDEMSTFKKLKFVMTMEECDACGHDYWAVAAGRFKDVEGLDGSMEWLDAYEGRKVQELDISQIREILQLRLKLENYGKDVTYMQFLEDRYALGRAYRRR